MVEVFKPFRPLKPAEGYGSYEFDDLDEAIVNFIKPMIEEEGAVAVEPKWDGIRLIVHYDGESVQAYTEDKQRDRAVILPTLVQAIRRVFGNHKVIVDGEILLGKLVDGEFKPVMRPNMMKIVVGKEPITDPIRYMVFDIVYLDGEDLTEQSFNARRKTLEELLDGKDDEIVKLTEQRIVRSVDEAKAAIEWAVSVTGSEGAMLKSLLAEYETDGRTTAWAKYKTWKALKCVIIGISKVFPPNTDPERWKEGFRKSRTYIFRCAVLGPDGQTLVPIETKRTLTESDLKLRYVRAGQIDEVTGKVATKNEWRGRDAKELWEMDEAFGHREPGEIAYGQTYAVKVEGSKPELGQLVEVAPIALDWFADDDGFVHLTWMHPRVISVGTDDPSEVSGWDRIVELLLASGREVPDVTVVDGKLKLSTNEQASVEQASVEQPVAGEVEANTVIGNRLRTIQLGRSGEAFGTLTSSLQRSLNVNFLVVRGSNYDGDEATNELGTPDKPLPKLFSNPFGISLSTTVTKAVARCIPDHKRYVELFSGTSPLIRAKPRALSEEEILVDLDEDVVALLRAIKSGEWRKLTRYNFRVSKRRWHEYWEALKDGAVSGIRRLYYWVYVTMYSLRGYAPVATFDRAKLPGGHRFKGFETDARLFFEHCELWEERLKGVKIIHGDAFDALEKYDSKTTFFFADPPWQYDEKQEFYVLNDFDHDRFVEAALQVKGKIIIVGLRGHLGKFREAGWSIRKLSYETPVVPVLHTTEEAPHIVEIDRRNWKTKRRVYLTANFDLPPARKIMHGSVPEDEGEELTHEEQRLEEEKRLGDSWRVVHDTDRFYDGYRAVYMRHYRGLWSPEQASTAREIVKRIIRARSDDERRQLFRQLTKELGAAVLLEDHDIVMELAQKASEARADVSAVIEKHSSDDFDEVMEHLDKISDLHDRVVNFVSVHGDLRIQNPKHPDTQLIGMTLMTPAAAFQFVDGEIVPVLRDKFLFNRDGDRIVAVKKARQPIVWLEVVNPKQQYLWSPPNAAGATPNSWALFEWCAFARVWFLMQRPDYHEIYIKFDELADDEWTVRDGKWVFRLLEGKGEKIGKSGLYWQFWYPEKDGQLPYVLTHTPEQAKREWKGRNYDYVCLNLQTIEVLIEQFPELEDLIASKRKASERLEKLSEWQDLEKP